jgi:hypothetical protein
VRIRLVILIAVGGLAVSAPEALAQAPAPLAPPDEASFMARPGAITFRAFSGAQPAQMEFYISDNTDKNDEGVLSDPVDVIVVGPISGDPTEFAAQPDPSEDWPLTPGTYHWQAVYQDCGQGGDCSIEGPIRSLTLTPWRNPPDPLAPEDGGSFEARPNQVTFRAFTDSSPSSAQFYFYVSGDAERDADGVLANEVDVISGVPRSGQPGVYQGEPESQSAETWPRTPGVYYWQAVYFDCDESADCWNEGPIRSLTITSWSNPPTHLEPESGASFVARADQITFRARSSASPNLMRFYVARDTAINSDDGVLANWIDTFAVGPTGGPPADYVGHPGAAETWPETPGTYYWQAVYHDCGESADCWNESPPRSFTITALPPPALGLPADGATIAFGGSSPFSVQDPDYARAGTSLHIEFATSDDLDPNGTLADADRLVLGSPVHVQGNTYVYQLAAPYTRQPGTYYWMVYRADGLAEQDGIVTHGVVRSFTVAEPSGPRPQTMLTRHPPKRTHRRTVKFAFRSNIKGATYQCFYRGGWVGCESPEVFKGLRPGRYKFLVRAIANGKRDKSPAKWVFTVLR